MMTKRDFEAIADAIQWNSKTLSEARRTVQVVAPALRDRSQLTTNGNRSFDVDRFRKAATERWS